MRNEWMSRSGVGLMVHWLLPDVKPLRQPGLSDPEEMVDRFPLERFMEQFEQSQAKWLIFTIGQNTGFYCSPSALLDGTCPGHTSRRDLIGQLAEAVHRMGKRFIAYLPSEVAAQSPEIHRAFAWTTQEGTAQEAFQESYCRFIAEYAQRWGRNLDGWWYDGCYGWSIFNNTLYQWDKWFKASRAGNPEALVCFNDGAFCVGLTQPVTPQQDYLAGEVESLVDGKIRLGRGQLVQTHLPSECYAPGTQTLWHALIPIDAFWMYGTQVPDGEHLSVMRRAWQATRPGAMTPSAYSTDELKGFSATCRAAGGAITFNVGLSQEGIMNPATIAQVAEVVESVG